MMTSHVLIPFRSLRQRITTAWAAWRWRRWRAAVVRIAAREFAPIVDPGMAEFEAEDWVFSNEPALLWWFQDGATPDDAYCAVEEEHG